MKNNIGSLAPANWFGITAHAKCWEVRLKYVDGKPKYQKRFYFTSIGSKIKALSRAIKFRDIRVANMEKAGYVAGSRVRTNPQSNSTTGILGISRSEGKTKGTDKPNGCHSWQTTFKDAETGKTVNCKFSENKWGAEKAQAMAQRCYNEKRRVYYKPKKVIE